MRSALLNTKGEVEIDWSIISVCIWKTVLHLDVRKWSFRLSIQWEDLGNELSGWFSFVFAYKEVQMRPLHFIWVFFGFMELILESCTHTLINGKLLICPYKKYVCLYTHNNDSFIYIFMWQKAQLIFFIKRFSHYLFYLFFCHLHRKHKTCG